jgi:hypothetical protein
MLEQKCVAIDLKNISWVWFKWGSFKGKNPVVELHKTLTMSSFLMRVASIYKGAIH